MTARSSGCIYLYVVLVAIEEVNFSGCLLDARVKVQHLEERSRPTFPYAYDETLLKASPDVPLKYRYMKRLEGEKGKESPD